MQNLKRKLALETKYLKHQLHAEMVKHKDTQKQLQDTLVKLESAEQREKRSLERSYQASRLSFHHGVAGKCVKANATSQSLLNIDDYKPDVTKIHHNNGWVLL